MSIFIISLVQFYINATYNIKGYQANLNFLSKFVFRKLACKKIK